MSLLSAVSHKNVLSHIAQNSLRTLHNTGCGCNNAIFLLYPKDDLKICTNTSPIQVTYII